MLMFQVFVPNFGLCKIVNMSLTFCFRMKPVISSLRALKLAGVHGVAVEVMWGIVECFSPMIYDWSLYKALFRLISDAGLKLHAALSFHSDMRWTVKGKQGVSLPLWIMEVGSCMLWDFFE